MTKLKYKVEIDDTSGVSISKGNSKLGKGIYSFSTLPGNTTHLLTLSSGELLTDVPGTCVNCDNCFGHGCYAVRDAKLHHNVTIPAWAKNTLLFRDGRALPQIDAFISKKNAKFAETQDIGDLEVRMFRINVAGELECAQDFIDWNELAKHHPAVKFGLYTKNFAALDTAMRSGMELANNFCINISQWHGCADEFLAGYPDTFNVFEYDDSNRSDCELPDSEKARLAAMQHCPAVDETGHHALNIAGNPITCDMCGRCYGKRGRGLKTAVYSH